MNAQSALQQQLATGHAILEQTIGDCSQEALDKNLPNATIGSIGSVYAHTVFGEDGIANGRLQGKPRIYDSEGWAEKLSVKPPEGPMQTPEWRQGVRMELASFHEYAKSVYAATEAYVSGLADADLDRKIDTGFAGEQTIAWMVGLLINHVDTHTGEIAALKGVQGLKGLPF